ncbi:MAG: ABC transporter ATP-binding protein, partial [Proteobacteria bacterium]|nr:ABC transporter ATP-binding protein [Pseudomonadota bacterium]
MLNLRNVTKSFNNRTLFKEASMTINYAERVALVGPNGAGKSTLFSLILKEDTADAGEIERDEWTTLGYLPQESEPVGDETILDVATGKGGEMERLEAILKDHEGRGDVNCAEYSEAHAKHDALHDPKAEAKAKKILAGFGFKLEDITRPAREFSGGW